MVDEKDRRAQILEAAFSEFATHGYRGATIKGIARAAKLQSQALIYWYFPTKEALFQSVVEAHLPFLQAMADPTPLLEQPPEEVLPYLAHTYLWSFEQPMARRLVSLLLPEVLRRRDLADLVGTRLIGRVLGFLTTYFTHQIELGRLRPHDVRSSARAFMGMLFPQAFGNVAMPILQADGLTNEEHIATTIDLFLHGLRPAE